MHALTGSSHKSYFIARRVSGRRDRTSVLDDTIIFVGNADVSSEELVSSMSKVEVSTLHNITTTSVAYNHNDI